MDVFLRNLTIVLVALTIMSGTFIDPLLRIFGIDLANISALRWVLVIGMPINIGLAYAWSCRQATSSLLDTVIRTTGLLVLFLAPYCWLGSHAG